MGVRVVGSMVLIIVLMILCAFVCVSCIIVGEKSEKEI